MWAAGVQIQQLMTDEQIIELADNLDCGLRCFVHKDSKTIVSVPDTINNPDSDSEYWDESKDEIENNFDSYIEIEKMNPNESFRLITNFIDTVGDSRQKNRFEEALNKPKPFRNFKFEFVPEKNVWPNFNPRHPRFAKLNQALLRSPARSEASSLDLVTWLPKNK